MGLRTTAARPAVSWRRRMVRAVSTHLLAAAIGGMLVGVVLTVVSLRTIANDAERRIPHPTRTPPADYDWTRQPAPLFPVPPYARHLVGTVIVLDPGHGGRADRPHWKRGPTGLREAEVNLRVARFLRDFLEAAGAEVHLTRERDVYLHADDRRDLAARPGLANRLRADLFLSIHHNGSTAPEANYTSIFYHPSPQHSSASLNVARHLLTGLNDALRLEQHLPCAVLSDRLLFENGLAVLRLAEVPAVLSEACFHSNPEQEHRLRSAVYNRREAYGLFLGIARWAQGGLPQVRLVDPPDGVLRRGQPLVFDLDDGLQSRGGWGSEQTRILPDSFVVRIDDQQARFEADLARRQLRLYPPPGRSGGYIRVYVDFQNVFGHHVLHPLVVARWGR